MNNWGHHLKLAVRQLWRNPGFVTTVIVTLALSIGANTAIFSLVNALMVKSLPYAHPERIGTIYTRVTGPRSSAKRRDLDGEQWEMLRDGAPALISAISGITSGVNLQAVSAVQYVRDGRVSARYFDVLALHPFIGRNFSEDEDRPHGAKVAILTYKLWRNLFGADRSILGQKILLKGEPYTVVGVLPQAITTPLNADLYTALQPSREGEGSGTNFDVITRLQEGATWQEADAEINRASALRAERFAKDNPGAHITYYFGAISEGRNRLVASEGAGVDVCCGSHSTHRLRESCGVDAGAHAAPHFGSGDSVGAGCIVLADPEAVLD
jgi:macrolide transport system ATP-binding/permease protein